MTRALGRFIPAHAGNRSQSEISRQKDPVHPRACGEQASNFLTAGLHGGSSPRMRGTGDSSAWPYRRKRFIPAHAGNSTCSRFQPCHAAVHPRACGEQQRGRSLHDGDSGSSPRMRGTERRHPAGPRHGRFIPAHAGNRFMPELGAA